MSRPAVSSDGPQGRLVARALWRIESNLARPFSLGDLAEAEGVSPFHLSRAFSVVLGLSPMAYVRARRLSEAARMLREGSDQVVSIAMAAGYASHEGFSRAFRDHFGMRPRQVRSDPAAVLSLQEPITMMSENLPPVSPEIVDFEGLKVAGLSERYTMETRAKIPALWERAIDEIGPAMFGVETYGICSGFEGEGFDYMVAVAGDRVADSEHLEHFTIPAGRYAVFRHEGMIPEIPQTWAAIFETWAPNAAVVLAEGPEFELYDKSFDPGKPGGVTIWIPVTET